MLLGTDGTVTHLLEAYAGEPIEVVKLLQEFDSSSDADGQLDVSVADKVLRRRVVLRSAHSKQNLLYAEAVVVLDRVDQAFLDGLLGTDKPIGKLLAETRTETFREILEVGRVPAGPCGVHFGIDATAELISRTYRIVARERPVILITEKFPPTFFRDVPL
jgi:chorismate-pyruvate lyase